MDEARQKRLLPLMPVILSISLLSNEGLCVAKANANSRKRAPETVLLMDRNATATTHRYVLPGATVVKFPNPGNLEYSERLRELEKFRKPYLTKPAVTTTLSRLPRRPESIRRIFLSCVENAIDENTRFTLEATAQLCAVGRSNAPTTVQSLVVNEKDKNQTLVVITGGFNTDHFEELATGRAINTPDGVAQAPQLCGYGQICNSCRGIDTLGLGLVEVKLSGRVRDIWWEILRKNPREVQPYQKQVAYKDKTHEVSSYQLGSTLSSAVLEQYRNKFREAGSSFDPATAILLKDSRKTSYLDWAEKKDGTICMECPAGSNSNGVNDCVSAQTGCSVLNGCPDVSECQDNAFGFTDDCPNSCEIYCQNLQRKLESLENEILPRFAKTPKHNKLLSIISDFRKRYEQESAICRRNPKAQVCETTQFSHFLALETPDVLYRSEELNCKDPQILVPTPNPAPITDQYTFNEYKECGDISCRWGMNNIRYLGESKIGNCPYFAVAQAVSAIRQQRWHARTRPLCVEETISESAIRTYFRETGFNCEAYAAMAAPPMFSPATAE